MREKPTIQQVSFQLEIQDCLLEMMAEGLDFLSKNSENRIIYVVDYTEVNPYWEAARPQQIDDLSNRGKRDKIDRIRDYLLPVEGIFLKFGSDREEELQHLKSAYDEQVELINALVCDKSIATIMLPNHWEFLRSDISYFANQKIDPIHNYNSSINLSNQDARSTIIELNSRGPVDRFHTEKTYIDSSETFGMWSLKLQPKATLFDIVKDFVDRSNFHLPADFPWDDEHFELSKTAIKSIKKISGPTKNTDEAQSWLSWIEKGNQEYNEVYGSSGKWHLREAGAVNLAYIQMLNELVQKARNSNIRVSLVSRNNQLQQAVWQARILDNSRNKPWVFHPRLLTTFMIDQSAGAATSSAALELEKYVRDFQDIIQITNELIGEVSGNGGDNKKVSDPLANYLRVRLRRGWEEYRKGNLAIRIRDRIKHRQKTWLPKGGGQRGEIEKFLKEIIVSRFEFLKYERERSLLKSLPTNEKLLVGKYNKDDGRLIRINHEDPDIGSLILFKGSYFTHAFLFQSEYIKNEINNQCDARMQPNEVAFCKITISNILKNSINKFENEEYLEWSINKNINQKRIFRFDVLLMCAVYFSSMKGADDNYRLPMAFLDAAQGIWANGNSTEFNRQVSEANYLDGILERLEWRKRAMQGDDLSGVFEEGKRILNKIIGYHKYDSDNIRIILLLAGFVRELFAFRAEKFSNHNRPAKINFSIVRALRLLNKAFEYSEKRGFCFGAARTRQQLLAFVRMWKAEKLPKSKALASRLNDKRAYEAFCDFVRIMKHLREERILDESDIPSTAIVSENLGIWEYREWLDEEPTKKEIRFAFREIEKRLKYIKEESHLRYIRRIMKEMEQSIQK